MNHSQVYDQWLSHKSLDEDLRKELLAIASDDEEKEERFYKELDFGTSGIRGKMGAGTNRINVHTVERATQGLSNHILDSNKPPKVAIAYDSRNNSKEYANAVARVFAANGIEVHVFEEITPVAALSYAIRRLHLSMGVMITASHNPKEYNGYKVYDENGCQLRDDECKAIFERISKLDYFSDIKRGETAKILSIEDDILKDYVNEAVKRSISSQDMEDIKIVYTPLNGSGRRFVSEALIKGGVKEEHLYLVESQKEADGNFTSCPSPNPENISVYREAIELCDEVQGDVILATDPDCDRVGVCVRRGDKYWYPTGNQMGILLFHYICENRDISEGNTVVRSIVSSPLIDIIARERAIKLETTLTGFKYIGEKMEDLGDDFLFGFEEAIGYLAANHVRDKDGVSISLLIVQMAANYKAKGQDLYDALYEIYEEHGYCREEALSYTFEGIKGAEKIKEVMEELRENSDKYFDREVKKLDYIEGVGDLPKSNVLSFEISEKEKIIIRPSGTEPKIKAYIFAQGANKEEVLDMLDVERRTVESIVRA